MMARLMLGIFLSVTVHSLFNDYNVITQATSYYDCVGISPDATILAMGNTNFSIIIQQKIGLDYQFIQEITGTN